MNNTIKENPVLTKAISMVIADKVEEPVLLDLRSYNSILDEFLIICTCKSEAQMRTILSRLKKWLSSNGEKKIQVDYSPGVKWGILSCSEFVLHIFEKSTRDYYSLERLWGEENLTSIDPEDYKQDLEETTDEHEFL